MGCYFHFRVFSRVLESNTTQSVVVASDPSLGRTRRSLGNSLELGHGSFYTISAIDDTVYKTNDANSQNATEEDTAAEVSTTGDTATITDDTVPEASDEKASKSKYSPKPKNLTQVRDSKRSKDFITSKDPINTRYKVQFKDPTYSKDSTYSKDPTYSKEPTYSKDPTYSKEKTKSNPRKDITKTKYIKKFKQANSSNSIKLKNQIERINDNLEHFSSNPRQTKNESSKQKFVEKTYGKVITNDERGKIVQRSDLNIQKQKSDSNIEIKKRDFDFEIGKSVIENGVVKVDFGLNNAVFGITGSKDNTEQNINLHHESSWMKPEIYRTVFTPGTNSINQSSLQGNSENIRRDF